MKKAFLLSITLSVITLAAVFVFSHTKSADDEVLKANIEALAGNDYYFSVSCNLFGENPPVWWVTFGDGNHECYDEFGRHNGVCYCFGSGGGGGNL